MGIITAGSHDLTAFYDMISASYGVLSQNTGFYSSLDMIIETMRGPLNLGPGGGSYNEPISCLQRAHAFRIWPHFRIWMHPSILASHLGGFFHHKPALVAPFILWLEYLLCAHHLPSTSGNIPHCTCTRTPTPSPAALPHWAVPVHPCFPLPGGIFTTNQP